MELYVKAQNGENGRRSGLIGGIGMVDIHPTKCNICGGKVIYTKAEKEDEEMKLIKQAIALVKCLS